MVFIARLCYQAESILPSGKVGICIHFSRIPGFGDALGTHWGSFGVALGSH